MSSKTDTDFKIGKIFGMLDGIKADINELKSGFKILNANVSKITKNYVILETKINDKKGIDKKFLVIITSLTTIISSLISLLMRFAK